MLLTISIVHPRRSQSHFCEYRGPTAWRSTLQMTKILQDGKNVCVQFDDTTLVQQRDPTPVKQRDRRSGKPYPSESPSMATETLRARSVDPQSRGYREAVGPNMGAQQLDVSSIEQRRTLFVETPSRGTPIHHASCLVRCSQQQVHVGSVV